MASNGRGYGGTVPVDDKAACLKACEANAKFHGKAYYCFSSEDNYQEVIGFFEPN